MASEWRLLQLQGRHHQAPCSFRLWGVWALQFQTADPDWEFGEHSKRPVTSPGRNQFPLSSICTNGIRIRGLSARIERVENSGADRRIRSYSTNEPSICGVVALMDDAKGDGFLILKSRRQNRRRVIRLRKTRRTLKKQKQNGFVLAASHSRWWQLDSVQSCWPWLYLCLPRS